MLWGFYTYAERKAGEQATAQFKYTYESKSYFNGLTFALYSVMFSFSLLIPIFVTMTGGLADCRRTPDGHAAHDLRPSDLAGLAGAVEIPGGGLLYLLAGGVFYRPEFAGGLALRGLGRSATVSRARSILWMNPASLLRDEALWRFAYASVSGTWALLVIAAVAMLFSVLFDNPATATVATLALYLVFHIVGRVEFFEHLRHLLLHYRHGLLA